MRFFLILSSRKFQPSRHFLFLPPATYGIHIEKLKGTTYKSIENVDSFKRRHRLNRLHLSPGLDPIKKFFIIFFSRPECAKFDITIISD